VTDRIDLRHCSSLFVEVPAHADVLAADIFDSFGSAASRARLPSTRGAGCFATPPH
jgi:hypothetical protein